jgi:hypothetical protein
MGTIISLSYENPIGWILFQPFLNINAMRLMICLSNVRDNDLRISDGTALTINNWNLHLVNIFGGFQRIIMGSQIKFFRNIFLSYTRISTNEWYTLTLKPRIPPKQVNKFLSNHRKIQLWVRQKRLSINRSAFQDWRSNEKFVTQLECR